MIQIGIYASPGGTSLLYVIGFIGILGGLVMAFLLLMRMGLLVVITAALPIAGAAGGTKIGSQAYEKMIAWTRVLAVQAGRLVRDRGSGNAFHAVCTLP